MRNASITNRSAFAYLKPETPSDKRSLWKLAAYLAGVFAIVGALVVLKHLDREIRDRTWNAALATIEEGRPRLVSQGHSQGGGAMLYRPELLMKYPVSGVMQERWIVLEGSPTLLTNVQFAIFRLKGHACTVRWKPTDPNTVIAEAS